jgi:hypothetical protein
MQYLVSVIADGAELATPGEMVAIDAFNDRIRAHGSLVFANGLAEPSLGTVIEGRGEEPVFTDGPSWSRRSSSPVSGSSRLLTFDVALELAVDGSKARNRRIELRPLLAITPTMRPAPTCCAGWAVVRSRARRTTRRSRSRATPPRSPT